MLETGTLNLLTGGPSAGKTTLLYQAIAAHEKGEAFLVPPLTFPPGQIVVVNTDRGAESNRRFFDAMGIRNTMFISVLDDRSFNTIDHEAALMRKKITEIIAGLRISTLVLDLYGDFITGKVGDVKALAHDGRQNVQWAEDLGCAILGLAYPYKQKANTVAKRVQDRVGGALTLQASANWKLVITDKAETGSHWIVDAIPGPMGGPSLTFNLTRAADADGVGRFIPYNGDGQPENDLSTADLVRELMDRYGISQASAYRMLKRMRPDGGTP